MKSYYPYLNYISPFSIIFTNYQFIFIPSQMFNKIGIGYLPATQRSAYPHISDVLSVKHYPNPEYSRALCPNLYIYPFFYSTTDAEKTKRVVIKLQ